MSRVWVSIGSNQARKVSICGGVLALRERFGDLVLSRVYESDAVGFDGQPFYNLVAGFHSDERVGDIKAALRAIEEAHGRERGAQKFSPRTLDLDLLTCGDLVGTFDGYSLPRDEILRCAFVLGPLAEVAGDESHPIVGRRYRELWRDFDKSSQPLVPVGVDLGFRT